MQKFIKFPSIGQFRDAIKQVQQACNYHNVALPVVDFTGHVKLHGTNAAVVIAADGTWHCQSRERIITPESDNAGFAAWVYGNKQYWDKLASLLMTACYTPEDTIQIYGEWCGGNIQKGVGLSKLDKMFVIFGLRFGPDGDGTEWHELRDWEAEFWDTTMPDNLHFRHHFPEYHVTVDFNSPTLIQNHLVEITEAVEKDCPVARYFLPDSTEELIGEGVVWSIDFESSENSENIPEVLSHMFAGLRFKVKGEKHSASKVKTIAPVDVDKVKSIDAFVEYACTENRLKQGLDKLTEMGLEHSTKSTGDYIKWIMQDILKEELDTMISSGIEPRDVNGQVARKAREFFMSQVA